MAKMKELKEIFAREVSSFLRTSGFSEKVYEHMQQRKKIFAEQDGHDASNHLELKRLLIADAEATFRETPHYETLVQRVESLIKEKSSSIT